MIKDENIESRDNTVINDAPAADTPSAKPEGEGGEHRHSERSHHHGHHHSHHGHHSHHSHHGHHSHHSHHHSSSSKKRKSSKSKSKDKNKRKESFRRFVKRNKMYLIYAATVLVFISCLVVMAAHLDNKGNNPTTDQGGSGINITDKLVVSVPVFADDVSIVGPAVKAYISAESRVSAVDIYKHYYSSGARHDKGLPVKLSYKVSGAPEGYVIEDVELLVADNEGLENPYTVVKNDTQAEIDVYNLKTNTKYYYSVNVTFDNGVETTVSGSFKTAEGPRLMNVSGVNNMRDIGGWVTEDGSVIKQGLLYRGCEIDGAVEPGYVITPEGLETMVSILGIKTDMDLRMPSENKYGTDALGSGVEHTYYSSAMYANIFKPENAEKMRAIFADLADESNYPIYMHCTYGQDRTGTVCYVLEALLGLSEEDLMKEYQLSALFHGYQPIDAMNDFVEAFKALEGETMSEKAEGYLLSIGVTADEIANIRRIHLS